jgi:hypothetical protein
MKHGPRDSIVLRQLCPSALLQAPQRPGNVEDDDPCRFLPARNRQRNTEKVYVPCDGASTALLSLCTGYNANNTTPHHFLERLSAACHARRGRLRGHPLPLATRTWPTTTLPCSVHCWHSGELQRAMEISCAVGGTVQLHQHPAYEGSHETQCHCLCCTKRQ